MRMFKRFEEEQSKPQLEMLGAAPGDQTRHR